MKIEIIKASNKEFEAASASILEIYNTDGHSLFSETLEIRYKHLAFIARPVGSAGGLVFSQLADFPQYANILFAAFPKAERKQGRLTATLQKARHYIKKRNSRIISVELNPLDDPNIWRHYGFRHEGFLNYVQNLFVEPPEKLFPIENQQSMEGGLDVSDLMIAKLLNDYD